MPLPRKWRISAGRLESRASAGAARLARLPRVPRLFPCAITQRPRRRVVAVSCRRRPDADLRRHPCRQFCARVALHAGRVPRVDLRRYLRARPAWILGRRHARRALRRRDRRANRTFLVEANLRGARATSARGNLWHRADRARRNACSLGGGRPARPARRGFHRCGRSLRPRGADVRSPVAGDRTSHPRRALGAHDPDAFWRRHPRRDREPHADRRARHRSKRALFGGVRAGRVSRRAGRRIAPARRAGESRHGSFGDRRSVRGDRGRRSRFDSRRVRRGARDRPHTRVMHCAGNDRHRRRRDCISEVDAGCRIRRHGSRARSQAVRIAGIGTGDAADDTDCRVPRARRSAGTAGIDGCGCRHDDRGAVAVCR